MVNNQVELGLIRTNLRRYTFESKRMKEWVERNSHGLCLNLFSGKTLLDIDEVRVDISDEAVKDYQMDALDFVMFAIGEGVGFDTIILDPPYSYRKAMEMYNGNYSSRFKRIADVVPGLLKDGGKVISFGYHSTFLGKKRGARLDKLCVFAHGGAQHCTIGIIESIAEHNYLPLTTCVIRGNIYVGEVLAPPGGRAPERTNGMKGAQKQGSVPNALPSS